MTNRRLKRRDSLYNEILNDSFEGRMLLREVNREDRLAEESSNATRLLATAIFTLVLYLLIF